MILRTTAAALALALALPALAATQEPAKSAPAKADGAKSPPLTKGEVAKADENRKKPLQRCDELKGDAQLECLRKAREKIVQAREQREGKR